MPSEYRRLVAGPSWCLWVLFRQSSTVRGWAPLLAPAAHRCHSQSWHLSDFHPTTSDGEGKAGCGFPTQRNWVFVGSAPGRSSLARHNPLLLSGRSPRRRGRRGSDYCTPRPSSEGFSLSLETSRCFPAGGTASIRGCSTDT